MKVYVCYSIDTTSYYEKIDSIYGVYSSIDKAKAYLTVEEFITKDARWEWEYKGEAVTRVIGDYGTVAQEFHIAEFTIDFQREGFEY